MKEEVNKINVEPQGSMVIVKLKMETDSGIILTGSSDSPLDTEVVAVGPDAKGINVGDKVMAVGSSYMFSVDGEEYCLIYQSQILMKVINGAKVLALNKPVGNPNM